MSKTIVVFGAATGLGTRVARSYGAKGYDVVLVGRQAPPLQALASELGREGIYPRTFIGDLTIPEHAAALVRSIRHTLPSLDAIYYGPDQPQPYLPATAVALDTAQEWADLLFLSLVAVVNEVLPEMRARRAGAILVAQSRTADKGTPYLSGPGPAMA
ncbi:MAG TPA: SDR family NAD(P)-dependent oxidoreductase, partial [Pseudomonas sp.]|nr:SDR family NAD(P)-dependent oxidoreductase [Pseudomonas sp.]